jgi:hypothetical protein
MEISMKDDMYNIIPLEEKNYHLFSIEQGEIEGDFYDWEHVLWWFDYADLKIVGHNKNDTTYETDYFYSKVQYILRPKKYILLDFDLSVVSVDHLAKALESYQRVYPNPYRAVKRGTNKKTAWAGFRYSTHFYKNIVAYLLENKKEFPLNKREKDHVRRMWDWDAGRRSNKGSSWKLKKKKKQWDRY